MIRVGLTGSIATGKSFVSSVFVDCGCHVIDADLLARQVVECGTQGLARIVDEFGAEILNSDGSLNRAALGRQVFADEAKRTRLNSILHPLIFAAQDEWLREREEEDPQGVAIVDAALMIETGSHTRFDKLIVVHCRPEIQLQRLMKRDKLDRDEALRRIASQLSQDEKLRHADYTVDTSGTFEETRQTAIGICRELKRLAGK